MKVVFSFVLGLTLLAGLMFAADSAQAGGDMLADPLPPGGCYGGPCGAYLVPAPNPIPRRRFVTAPAPLPLPCVGPCVSPANVYAAPPPCGQGGCGGRAFVYVQNRLYPFWKQPGYTVCYPGMANCYWRRDCWYDSFGRRFCN